MRNIYQHYIVSYSGLPKAAWMLSFVVFVNRVGSVVLFFLTLYLTKKLNFSVSDAGKLISIYGLGSLAGSYLGGVLSDKIGTAKVQFWSLVFSGIGYISFVWVDSFAEIAVLLILLAVVAEAFRPANITAFSQVCPPELRPRGYALNRLAINLGVAIGPAIGGFIARQNYSLLFWLDGLTCLLSAGIFKLVFHQKTAFTPKAADAKSNARSPWGDKIFLLVLFLLLLMGLVFFQLFNSWPLFLRDRFGLLEDQIGLLLAVNAIFLVLVEMPVIHKLERFNPVKIITAGSLFLFAGFAILPLGFSFQFAIFTVLVWTVGEMMVFPLTSSFIANRASDQSRGRYMGMYTFTFSVAFVIGPMTGAWIYQNIGAVFLWELVGILGVITASGFLLVLKLLGKEKSSLNNV